MSVEVKSLAEIASEAMAIEEVILQNGGELSPEIEAWLNEVDSQLGFKADRYKFAMDRFESSAKMFRERAEEFTRAAKAIETIGVRLKDRIKQVMLATGRTEVFGRNYRFKISSAAPRIVIHEHELPIAYKRQVVTTEPDKELIKEAVKQGHAVAGVDVQPNHALRITVNKD